MRIAYLQIFKRNFFNSLAQAQYHKIIPLEGKRGQIFDCRGRVLATSAYTYSVFVDPMLVDDKNYVSEVLSSKLSVPKEKLLSQLNTKKRFVWVKRKISLKEKEELKRYRLKGVGFIREQKRYYPQQNLASTVLGLVDIDNIGIEGIELFYDKYLRGKTGWIEVLQDSRQTELLFGTEVLVPKEGADIILTVDAQIQYWAEKYLVDTIKKFSAKEGSVVVMNADTGEILALANYPFFNPNNYDSRPNERRNRAVVDIFEPGSVFKIVTLLAAIEKNAFSDNEQIFCENGKYAIPGSILSDWKPYGYLSFKEVFKKSSNIGVAKIANKIGSKILYEYIKKLGFAEKTGIDFPGEQAGKLKPLRYWSKTSHYIIPIGQEVAVNLLQLVRAFAVIANDGYLVKPYLVKKVSSPFFTKEFFPERKKVLSESTTKRAKDILISVVEDGTAVLAKIDNVVIGGKTGTAQTFDVKLGRYSPTDYRASFIGFISEHNPRLVIGVSIFSPQKSHFGGVVAAPLFKRIAEKVLNYFESTNTLLQYQYEIN